MADIEYFYAAHSAFAYLGATYLEKIANETGRRIVHKPMDLGLVVAAAHPNGSGKRSSAHMNYYFGREIERWAEYRRVDFKGGIPATHRHSVEPANTLLIACATKGGEVDKLAYAIMQAHWLDHADLADEQTLADVAKSVGLDPAPLFKTAQTPQIKEIYQANTSEAIARSVFGSPTYFIDGDMFYGQDHLELVERAIRQPFADTWS